MKNVKMILPIVAFIFAVVGAFASINAEVTATYYVQLNNECDEITVACAEIGDYICRIQGSDNVIRNVVESKLSATTCSNDVVLHNSPEPF